VPATDDEIQEKYLERAIRELNQLTRELQECEHCPRGKLMPVLGSGHPQADILMVKYAATGAEIERARSQQNDTVARLVERTTQYARVEEERDASRDAEWEGALQRAIGMLSVLESLDDVIVTLRLKPDRRSVARLQHFEREARKMAGLVELEEIAVVGCVDPDQHEIVSTVGGTARVGTIVEVRQRGYMFRGRILRRAQVVVSARD